MAELLRYDAACRALAEAKAVDEVKEVRDRAEALRHYARQANNRDLEIDAAEIRFRAERRIGELIIDQKQAEGLNRGSLRRGSLPAPRDDRLTLADLGVDKKLSSRAQKIAAVDDGKFEQMIGEWRDRVSSETERVTTNLLREGEKAQRKAANQAAVEGGGTVSDLYRLIEAGTTFAAIYADPAWTYETWGERGQDRSAIQHYQTESLIEIKAKPVARLAADDAVLHLWCPSSMLDQGFEVIDAWGFVFKKIGFVWGKLNPSGEGRHMGNGHWQRDEDEFCLFATRGHPKRLNADVRQHYDSPVGEHSEKPEEFRTRIERLTAGPYLELYGRRRAEGWTVWGNQVVWEPPQEGEHGRDHQDAAAAEPVAEPKEGDCGDRDLSVGEDHRDRPRAITPGTVIIDHDPLEIPTKFRRSGVST